VLWIDAALTSAQAGLQTMTEAFLAHAVIPSETGAPVRVSTGRARSSRRAS